MCSKLKPVNPLVHLPEAEVGSLNIKLPFVTNTALLFKASLLLLQVGILYFQPSVFRCILLRWVRLLGFATVYGTLTLKLYR